MPRSGRPGSWLEQNGQGQTRWSYRGHSGGEGRASLHRGHPVEMASRGSSLCSARSCEWDEGTMRTITWLTKFVWRYEYRMFDGCPSSCESQYSRIIRDATHTMGCHDERRKVVGNGRVVWGGIHRVDGYIRGL